MAAPHPPEPRRASMLGAVLGNYRILAALGRGGMGTVYRGEHALLGKPVAIKFLRRDLGRDGDLVQRFFTEARSAAAIQHPGIIDVFDFGYTPEGRAYLVMELLEGQSLHQRLAERGPMSESRATTIGRGIASALRAAHAKGIVHRDLKPDNVFLVPEAGSPGEERVKVLDFGVAKLLSEASSGMTQDGALMGTPLYMAPEQARTASAIDARADLYSLGCMLYELVCGRPPFVAAGAGEIIAMQMFEEPVALHTRAPAVSPAFAALVMRLLAKEPNDRPASAAEVLAALEQAAAERAPATPPGAGGRGHSRSMVRSADARALPTPSAKSRNTMPILAAVITVVIACAIVAIVWVRGDRTPSRRAVVPMPPAPVQVIPSAAQPAQVPAPASIEVAPPAPAGPGVPSGPQMPRLPKSPIAAPHHPSKSAAGSGAVTMPDHTAAGSPVDRGKL